MGAGNRYTLTEDNNILAYYVDTSCDCWEEGFYDCDCHEFTETELKEEIEKLPLFDRYGWDDSRNSCYYGEMFKITLEYGNHNEIVINFEFQGDFIQGGLQTYNYERSYLKVIKHLNKVFTLHQGHGYISSTYKIGEVA